MRNESDEGGERKQSDDINKEKGRMGMARKGSKVRRWGSLITLIVTLGEEYFRKGSKISGRIVFLSPKGPVNVGAGGTSHTDKLGRKRQRRRSRGGRF